MVHYRKISTPHSLLGFMSSRPGHSSLSTRPPLDHYCHNCYERCGLASSCHVTLIWFIFHPASHHTPLHLRHLRLDHPINNPTTTIIGNQNQPDHSNPMIMPPKPTFGPYSHHPQPLINSPPHTFTFSNPSWHPPQHTTPLFTSTQSSSNSVSMHQPQPPFHHSAPIHPTSLPLHFGVIVHIAPIRIIFSPELIASMPYWWGVVWSKVTHFVTTDKSWRQITFTISFTATTPIPDSKSIVKVLMARSPKSYCVTRRG